MIMNMIQLKILPLPIIQSRSTEDSFLDKLGITNLLPKEYSDTISISNTDNLDCSDYRGKAGKMCSDGISARMSGGINGNMEIKIHLIQINKIV